MNPFFLQICINCGIVFCVLFILLHNLTRSAHHLSNDLSVDKCLIHLCSVLSPAPTISRLSPCFSDLFHSEATDMCIKMMGAIYSTATANMPESNSPPDLVEIHFSIG